MMPSSLARRFPLQRRRDVARGQKRNKTMEVVCVRTAEWPLPTLHDVKHRRRAVGYSFEGFTNAGMSYPLAICLSM